MLFGAWRFKSSPGHHILEKASLHAGLFCFWPSTKRFCNTFCNTKRDTEMANSIPHTIQRNGIYWLNLRWNKTYLRTTLRTREPSKAIQLVGMILERLNSIRGTNVDTRQIKQLVRQWLHTQTNQLEIATAITGYYGKNPLQIRNKVYDTFMKGMTKSFDEAQHTLQAGSFSQIEDEAQRFANEHLGHPTRDGELAFLCRELTLAKRELARRIIEHDYRDHSGISSTENPNTIVSTEKLSDTWEKYLTESIKQGKLKERSETTYRQYFARFIDIVGDIHFTSLTKETTRTYKEELLDYPSFRTNKKHKAMTYQEVKKVESRRLSTSTINSNMVAINGFLSWSSQNGYIDDNPLEGMIITRDKEEEERDPFTQEELALIFSQPLFRGEKAKGKSRPVTEDDYWLPLLALFTGARIEELCRLRKKDIQTEGTFHYMEIMPPDLAPEMSDRKRKNSGKSKSAHRKIPIHPTLLDELNFREFVASKPDGYLLTLKEKQKRRSFFPSKDFGRLKSKLEFGKTKVFHSFRHTLRDTLTAAGVSGEFIKGIMGHSMKGDVTFGTYGSGIHLQPTVLAPHLYSVNYSHAIAEVKPWLEIKDDLKQRNEN